MSLLFLPLLDLYTHVYTWPDIVERFQLGLMLTVIAFRNLIEMSGSDFAFLPRSFIKGKGNVETIFSVSLLFSRVGGDAGID